MCSPDQNPTPEVHLSDAAQNSLHKIISDRQFFTRPYLPAVAAAVASALLLPIVVICLAGLTQLLLTGNPEVAPANHWLPRALADAGTRISLLRRPSSALTIFFGFLVIIVALRTLLRTFVRRTAARLTFGHVNRLREHIHRHALRCNPGDLEGIQARSAAGLFRNTATRLQEAAFNWSFRRLTSIPDLLVLAVFLTVIQWRVGLECLIPVIVCWIVGRIETERHEASKDLLEEQVDRGLDRLTSHLEKSRVVSGYGMETPEHTHFSAGLQNYQSRYDGMRRQEALGRWTSMLIYAAMFLLPAFIVSRHVVFGSLIDIVSGIGIAATLGWFVISLHRIQNDSKNVGAAMVAADSIHQYLLRVPSVSQVVGARFMDPMARLLQFDQVRVETETNPELLSGLDLKIMAGERVAIVTLNPQEAMALASLIPRFVDPAAGQVLIDGQDIRRATLESLRSEAVVVWGDEPVFSTTVRDNITAGQQEMSRQDAREAGKVAHAESFIRDLPRGYETDLGAHDSLLQTGQRFRLSLARAIARNPALLVIQEPEEALDSETKAMLDDTYERICANRTVLFLPTRLSTVKKCDRVILLNEGRVAADGPYQQLVRSNELYRHWEYVRFNVFRTSADA